MCGRFHVTLDYEALKELYAVQAGLTFESYNVAPSQLAPAVLPAGNQRSVALQRFGFIPFYAKDAKEGFKSINARVETVTEKPAFREAINARRCVIPASGFYEWADGKVKQPFYYSPPGGELLSFGGIWSSKRVAGVEVDSFAILTTAPHPVVSKIHDRSPLMLADDGVNRWLDPLPFASGELAALAADMPGVALSAWPVDRRVGSPRNNDADLVAPMALSPALDAPPEARAD